MTTVAAALNRIARQCSVSVPNGWATATRLEHVELRDDFLLEVVDEILDRIDLPSPVGKQVTITGDGSESYALPSNFKRLCRDAMAVYETTTLRRAGIPVHTDGAWTHLNTIGSAGTNRYYAIEGYEGAHTIKFERDLVTGNSVTVSYVSDVWVVDSGGTQSSSFDDDTDILMLPRRAVEMGTIARFRHRKGLDHSTWMAGFEAEMARLSSEARGIRTVTFGGEVSDYLPMRVPVPDYIPNA